MTESTFPFWAYAIRGIVVLVVLFIGFKLMGKRQVAQMNIYDLAMIMALANAVQNAMTGGRGDLPVALATSAGLLLVAYALSRLFVRRPQFQTSLLGIPTILISEGVVLKDRLRKECITESTLMEVLREHGLTDPKQVSVAVFEVDGSISVVPTDGPHRHSKKPKL
jgi:uncharacterized membrane protein YcaP (DUF421 family)